WGFVPFGCWCCHAATKRDAGPCRAQAETCPSGAKRPCDNAQHRALAAPQPTPNGNGRRDACTSPEGCRETSQGDQDASRQPCDTSASGTSNSSAAPSVRSEPDDEEPARHWTRSTAYACSGPRPDQS